MARVLVVDVDQPLPALEAGLSPAGRRYGAQILLRLHARPLGMMTVDLADGPVPPDRLRELIDEQWSDVINRHLSWHREPEMTIMSGPRETCALAPAPTSVVSVIVPTCRRPAGTSPAAWTPFWPPGTRSSRWSSSTTRRTQATRPHCGTPLRRRQSRPVRRSVCVRPGPAIAVSGTRVGRSSRSPTTTSWWIGTGSGRWRLPSRPIRTSSASPASCCRWPLGTEVQLRFEQYGGFNRGYRPRLFDLMGNRGDTRLYPYTAGAFGGLGNAAFRRSALRHPDAFDVTLGPGGPAFGAEDMDAFVALVRSGGRLLYEPAALVRHRHRETLRRPAVAGLHLWCGIHRRLGALVPAGARRRRRVGAPRARRAAGRIRTAA